VGGLGFSLRRSCIEECGGRSWVQMWVALEAETQNTWFWELLRSRSFIERWNIRAV
jgi:hypothetical protein